MYALYNRANASIGDKFYKAFSKYLEHDRHLEKGNSFMLVNFIEYQNFNNNNLYETLNTVFWSLLDFKLLPFLTFPDKKKTWLCTFSIMKPQEERKDEDINISSKQMVMHCWCSKMKHNNKGNFEFAR